MNSQSIRINLQTNKETMSKTGNLFDSFLLPNTTIVNHAPIAGYDNILSSSETTTHTETTVNPAQANTKPAITKEVWESQPDFFSSYSSSCDRVCTAVRHQYLKCGREVKSRSVISAPKEKVKPGQIEVNRDLLVLMGLKKNSKYLLEFFGWYEDTTQLYIAVESMPFETLANHGKVESEAEIKAITVQILFALRVVHQSGFVHGELTPSNINIVQANPYWIRLGGFGLFERDLPIDGPPPSLVLRRRHTAPELLQLFGYENTVTGEAVHVEATQAADMWSLGCIVHEMQTGYPPYCSLLDLFKFCIYGHVPSRDMGDLSVQGRGFLRKCLQGVPEERIGSAMEALKNEWLVDEREVRQDQEAGGMRGLDNILYSNSRGDEDHICQTIHCASRHDNIAILTQLLDDGWPLEQKNMLGRTALHTATSAHATTAASFLISRGANVDATDLFDCTPLHLAAREGCIDMIRILVQNGSTVTREDKAGSTAYKISIRHGHEDVSLFLLTQQTFTSLKDTHIGIAIGHGREKLTLALIERYAHLITPNCTAEEFPYDERTLLHDATGTNSAKTVIVRALLDLGFEISARDDDGETPLTLACLVDDVEMVKFLLDRGGDIHTTLPNGNTLLHRAAGRGHLSLIRPLIERGIDVNVRGNFQSTPLHFAKNQPVAEVLVELGADLDAIDKYGRAPGDISMHSNAAVAEYLVKMKAERGGGIGLLSSGIGTFLKGIWSGS